jgi:hypothetical protein
MQLNVISLEMTKSSLDLTLRINTSSISVKEVKEIMRKHLLPLYLTKIIN